MGLEDQLINEHVTSRDLNLKEKFYFVSGFVGSCGFIPSLIAIPFGSWEPSVASLTLMYGCAHLVKQSYNNRYGEGSARQDLDLCL